MTFIIFFRISTTKWGLPPYEIYKLFVLKYLDGKSVGLLICFHKEWSLNVFISWTLSITKQTSYLLWISMQVLSWNRSKNVLIYLLRQWVSYCFIQPSTNRSSQKLRSKCSSCILKNWWAISQKDGIILLDIYLLFSKL